LLQKAAAAQQTTSADETGGAAGGGEGEGRVFDAEFEEVKENQK
jgi:hypothetical protein